METKTEYQKINTLFMRDSNNVIMPDMWADPTIESLADTEWEATEKVDGTNIRIIITPPPTEGAPVGVEFRGRTDAAQIPGHLLKRLEELFPVDKMTEQFNPAVRPMKDTIVLYGEGYGRRSKAADATSVAAPTSSSSTSAWEIGGCCAIKWRASPTH